MKKRLAGTTRGYQEAMKRMVKWAGVEERITYVKGILSLDFTFWFPSSKSM